MYIVIYLSFKERNLAKVGNCFCCKRRVGGMEAEWSKALLVRQKNENHKILGWPPGLDNL